MIIVYEATYIFRPSLFPVISIHTFTTPFTIHPPRPSQIHGNERQHVDCGHQHREILSDGFRGLSLF